MNRNMNIWNKFVAALMISVLLLPAFSIPALAEEAGSERTPSGIPYAKLEQEIDSYVNDYIGTSTPGAAVVVTRGDSIIFSKGYGYANVEKHIPVDPANTVFGFGSINKLFVWTSVMQLAEAGQIELDQDIRTYLPQEFAEKLRYNQPVTMLDLMSHTAGFEEYSGGVFVKPSGKSASLEEVLLSSQPEQIFEPGTVMSYSNFATALAGFVVEKVSGERFSDYEMKRILRPLGMNHTSGHPALQDHPDLKEAEATGYAIAATERFEPREKYDIPYYPAGAMKGTAEDLAQFALALTADDSPLFSNRQTLHTMLAQSYTPHQDLLSNAHGFWEYHAQPRTLGHSGGTIGFSSNFAVVPEEKLGIVVLTNTEGEREIVPHLINLIIGNNEEEPAQPSEDLLPSSEAAGYYVLSRNTFTTIQEVMAYLGLIRLEAKGEHDLALTVMGRSGYYKQVHPYIYTLEKTDYQSLQMMAPVLYVDKSEGQITRLSGGQAMDLLPVNPSRSVPALMVYLVVAAIAIGFFLLAPLGLFLRWLIRRKKGVAPSSRANRWFSAALLCGTAIMINVLLLLMDVVGNPHLLVERLNYGITINWILAMLAGLFFALSLWIGRNIPHSRGQIWFRATTAALLIGFILLMADWHFFHYIA
ncbi:beta-lactamase family protein [Paenibacillus thiaminolyticus]|uniref:serine hydrolase domain-containing protein n=1 Tax=Paenibacillus thiaminolyticus TaxID=49283 RepID=UPI0011638692|nr:serine hydrolase [Paenibacillus thiaminolyticus]NGP58449.1 beta-lactamase family protein [Paenibacillus thiaminolyticus]